MLVPIVFIVAFAVALAGVVLENGFRSAQTALRTSVARYSDATIADGVADFTHGLAGHVERYGSHGPWPTQTSRSAPRSVCAMAAACPFTYTLAARITGASGVAGASTGDAAPNLQGAAIDEQRLSAVVTVTIASTSGTVLGARTRYLTYRVFETAPYAVISGARDDASVNGWQAAAQGDSGGAPAQPEQNDAALTDDTRIHVRLTCRTVIRGVVPLVNDQQVAGNDGLPWGNAAQAAYEAPCHRPDAPADAFHDEHWSNGDADASGWTQ